LIQTVTLPNQAGIRNSLLSGNFAAIRFDLARFGMPENKKRACAGPAAKGGATPVCTEMEKTKPPLAAEQRFVRIRAQVSSRLHLNGMPYNSDVLSFSDTIDIPRCKTPRDDFFVGRTQVAVPHWRNPRFSLSVYGKYCHLRGAIDGSARLCNLYPTPVWQQFALPVFVEHRSARLPA
jgi:hypothetical protein